MKKALLLGFLILLVISVFYLPFIYAQDYTGWELPEGAIARLGKGRINHLRYSPDGTLLVVATTIGIWVYDTVMYKEQALLTPKNKNVERILFDPTGTAMASVEGLSGLTLWDVKAHIPQKRFRLNSSPFGKPIFSPDGSTLATTDYRDILLNDAVTGENKHKLKGHEEFIVSLSFSPDSQILASGGKDTSIRLWDVDTGKQKKTLRGHADTVHNLSFSPNGSTLISVSEDNSIYFWDVSTGVRKNVLAEKGLITEQLDASETLEKVFFSSDDSTLVTVKFNNTIRLWDTTTGTLKQTINSQEKGIEEDDILKKIESILFSWDNRTIVALTSDGKIQLWDAATGKRRDIIGNTGFVRNLSFSPDSKTLVTGIFGGVIRFWDVDTGKHKKTISDISFNHYIGYPYEVLPITFSREKAAYAGRKGSVYLWDIDTKRQQTLIQENPYRDRLPIINTLFSPDGSTLASWNLNSDTTIRLWDVRAGKRLRVLKGHKERIRKVSFSPDSATMASWSAFEETVILLWDVVTGRQKQTLIGHTQLVESVSFSPDGATLVSGGLDGIVRIWNTDTGKEVMSLIHPLKENDLETKTAAVTCVRFNPDGSVVAGGNRNGVIHLWDVDSSKLIQTLNGHIESISSLTFSSDGKTIASTSKDGTIRLWNVDTSEQIQAIAGPKGTIWRLFFYPNGLPIACGYQKLDAFSRSKSIDLWDLQTGNLLKTLTGHSYFVTNMLFSADGYTLASLSFDDTVLLWDLTSTIESFDVR